jgi:hypothetical protein
MICLDARLIRAVGEMNLEEARQRAHHDGLARQPREMQTGRLSCLAGRMLGQLGTRLVALGERLEQHTPVGPSL